MKFGAALAALEYGERVCRQGWNGKGMFLFMVGPHGIDHFSSRAQVSKGMPEPYWHFEIEPFIAMKTADDKVVPWLASQTDVLAKDWEVL